MTIVHGYDKVLMFSVNVDPARLKNRKKMPFLGTCGVFDKNEVVSLFLSCTLNPKRRQTHPYSTFKFNITQLVIRVELQIIQQK